MIIVKRTPDEFSHIPIVDLHNRDLSWQAKGIWAYLMSLEDERLITIDDVMKHGPSEDFVKTGLQELVKAGLISAMPPQNLNL